MQSGALVAALLVAIVTIIGWYKGGPIEAIRYLLVLAAASGAAIALMMAARIAVQPSDMDDCNGYQQSNRLLAHHPR